MSGPSSLSALVEPKRCTKPEEEKRKCLSADTLRAWAKRLHITGATKMTKPNLYAALRAHPEFRPSDAWSRAHPSDLHPRAKKQGKVRPDQPETSRVRRPTNPCGRLRPPPCPSDREVRSNPRGVSCCYKKRVRKSRAKRPAVSRDTSSIGSTPIVRPRATSKRPMGSSSSGPSSRSSVRPPVPSGVVRPCPIRALSPEQLDVFVREETRSVVSPVRQVRSPNLNTKRDGHPRRILLFMRAGKKSYAIKFTPPKDFQYVREAHVYKALSRPIPPFRPADDMVRMVDSGTVTFHPFSREQSTMEIAFEPGNKRTFEIPKATMHAMAQTMIERYDIFKEVDGSGLSGPEIADLRAEKASAKLPFRYLVTEIHDGFMTMSTAMEHIEEAFPNPKEHTPIFHRWFLSLVGVVCRAHIAHGFSHYDLHPENVLIRITFRGRPINEASKLNSLVRRDSILASDISCQVRLFDFDLAYVPSTQTAQAPTYNLWAYAVLRLRPTSNKSELKRYAPLGFYYDMMTIIASFFPKSKTFASPAPKIEACVLKQLREVLVETALRGPRSKPRSSVESMADMVLEQLFRSLYEMISIGTCGTLWRDLLFIGAHRLRDQIERGFRFPAYA